MTYTLIESITLSTASSSVSFTGLDAYVADGIRDLVVMVDVKGATGFVYPGLRLNNDSSATYYNVNMLGQSSGGRYSGKNNDTRALITYNTFANTDMGNFIIANVFDYSETDKHKTIISRAGNIAGGGYDGGVEAVASRWNSTAQVTSLQILTLAGSFAVGSQIQLFGIEA